MRQIPMIKQTQAQVMAAKSRNLKRAVPLADVNRLAKRVAKEEKRTATFDVISAEPSFVVPSPRLSARLDALRSQPAPPDTTSNTDSNNNSNN